MQKRTLIQTGAAAALVAMLAACAELPGTRKQQTTGIGGVTGAAAGAIIAPEGHRLLGALIGGAVGAGAGYLIGARSERIRKGDEAAAQQAMEQAVSRPATAEDARRATTADLNNDGFVTLDEVVAMQEAGFADQEMIRRLEATGQVFELTAEQQTFLRQRGVSNNVIAQMEQINRDERERLLGAEGVIGRPPPERDF